MLLKNTSMQTSDLRATIKDLEEKKEAKGRDLTTIQLEIDELRKQKKGMCS